MTEIKYYVELKENPDYGSRLEILMLKPDLIYPMCVGYAVFSSQETWMFEEDDHFKDICETHKLDYEKESDRIDHLVNEYVSMMISSNVKYPYELEDKTMTEFTRENLGESYEEYLVFKDRLEGLTRDELNRLEIIIATIQDLSEI